MTSPHLKHSLRKIRITLTVLSTCAALSGCVVAAPSAFQLATYAADGASYAATGKSVTDHLISEVTAKDCALMRALDGQDVCTEIEPERMPDGTAVPNARNVALGVRPAEADQEFQSFAIATAAKGDSDDDEVLETPEDLSRSFAQPPDQAIVLQPQRSQSENADAEVRLTALSNDPIDAAVRAKAAPSILVHSESASPQAERELPPTENLIAQETTPQESTLEPKAPVAETDLPEEEDGVLSQDAQLADDEDEILDLTDIQELERAAPRGAAAN